MQKLDGLVPIAFPHNSVVTPTEVMETRAPVLILNKELLPDSAGAGRQRGGLGQIMTFRNIGDAPMNARVRPDKVFCSPPGIDGGEVGKVGEVRFNRQIITEFPILNFKPGDEIELRMPGGAGFGAANERDAAAIRQDVDLGYITAEGAKRDYNATI